MVDVPTQVTAEAPEEEPCRHPELAVTKIKNYKGQERYQAHCPDCGRTGLIGASEDSARKRVGDAARIAPTAHQARRRAIKPV